jgi:hypothetical protein
MRGQASRTLAITVAAIVITLASVAPATAGSRSDPNDVDGRLDIRWVGIHNEPHGWARLTLMFYDNFRRRALPKAHCSCARRVRVDLDRYVDGFYYRANGGIRFSYGDHGSSCCDVYKVERTSRTVLVVRYRVLADEGRTGHRVRARSDFVLADGTVEIDRTEPFYQPPP